MGDAYADIPKHGATFAKAVAVCINSRQWRNRRKTGDVSQLPGQRQFPLSHGWTSQTTQNRPVSDLTQEALRDPPSRNRRLCVSCKGCKRRCRDQRGYGLDQVEYHSPAVLRVRLRLRDRLFAHTRAGCTGRPAQTADTLAQPQRSPAGPAGANAGSVSAPNANSHNQRLGRSPFSDVSRPGPCPRGTSEWCC